MKGRYTKLDDGSWAIKVQIDVIEDVPKQGDTVVVEKRNGKKSEETLGVLIEGTADGDFIFAKGTSNKTKVKFMNLAGVQPATWRRFTSGITKLNTTLEDQIIEAHLSHTPDGMTVYLINSKHETMLFPLSELGFDIE